MYRLENWMSAIYQRWLTKNNLPQWSADEMLMHEKLTDYERNYCTRFYELWTRNERRQQP